MPSATAAYEAEQERLRQEQGLDEETQEADLEDLQIQEINPEVYKDVEPLLFRGFLTVAATINEASFVFKSVNHHEFEWLGMAHETERGEAAVSRFYDTFLAYGVAMVDGVNVLRRRDQHLPELTEFFTGLPKPARQKVVRHLSDLNRRANRAVLLVEPYVMENTSRLRWLQVKGLDLSATATTGFEGTQTLGLNWGQLTWRALNHLEDRREESEREWENAKFVASAMAGKGMQRVYNTDKRRRREAKQDQAARREKILRYAFLNEPIEEQKQSGTMVVARTVSELTRQLDRDLKGEKDWHDRVIEEHENRVRVNLEQREHAAQEKRLAHIREFGDRPVIAGTDISGLSHAEVQKRITERRALLTESLAAQAKHPELTDPKYGEFSRKWLQQPIVANAPSVMPARPRPRTAGKPFRRDS